MEQKKLETLNLRFGGDNEQVSDECEDERIANGSTQRPVSENWIDSQVVLQTLNISPRTLQTWRSNGTLPYSKIGKKFFYKQSDIHKILQNNYIMYNLRNKNS